IVSPFCDITKRDIALIGKEEGVPFEKTYSCYEGRHKHCGVCGTCVERKEALEGFDPTEYEK
ncbi:MAG: 7-cyano-7-deazaguanine synthase, partial [Bacteroidales bacterium]|nr:7-cyano-7-deazaguanine synthase [Bacteroidales bacterium]